MIPKRCLGLMSSSFRSRDRLNENHVRALVHVRGVRHYLCVSVCCIQCWAVEAGFASTPWICPTLPVEPDIRAVLFRDTSKSRDGSKLATVFLCSLPCRQECIGNAPPVKRLCTCIKQWNANAVKIVSFMNRMKYRMRHCASVSTSESCLLLVARHTCFTLKLLVSESAFELMATKFGTHKVCCKLHLWASQFWGDWCPRPNRNAYVFYWSYIIQFSVWSCRWTWCRKHTGCSLWWRCQGKISG